MAGADLLSRSDYNLETFNCTNFAAGVVNSTGVAQVPLTVQDFSFLGFIVASGPNPSDLGEDLKALPTGVLNVPQQPLKGPPSTCQ